MYDTQPSSMPPDTFLDTRPVDHETTVPRVNFGYAGEGEGESTAAQGLFACSSANGADLKGAPLLAQPLDSDHHF